MDLQTVQSKLQTPFDDDDVMAYRDLGHFAADIRWIWEASKIYNQDSKALPAQYEMLLSEAEAARDMAREAGGGDLREGAKKGPFYPTPERVAAARRKLQEKGILYLKDGREVTEKNFYFVAATMELEFEAIWGEFTLWPWEDIRRREVNQKLQKKDMAERVKKAAEAPKMTEEEKKARLERQLELDRKKEEEMREQEKVRQEQLKKEMEERKQRMKEEQLRRKQQDRYRKQANLARKQEDFRQLQAKSSSGAMEHFDQLARGAMAAPGGESSSGWSWGDSAALEQASSASRVSAGVGGTGSSHGDSVELDDDSDGSLSDDGLDVDLEGGASEGVAGAAAAAADSGGVGGSGGGFSLRQALCGILCDTEQGGSHAGAQSVNGRKAGSSQRGSTGVKKKDEPLESLLERAMGGLWHEGMKSGRVPGYRAVSGAGSSVISARASSSGIDAPRASGDIIQITARPSSQHDREGSAGPIDATVSVKLMDSGSGKGDGEDGAAGAKGVIGCVLAVAPVEPGEQASMHSDPSTAMEWACSACVVGSSRNTGEQGDSEKQAEGEGEGKAGADDQGGLRLTVSMGVARLPDGRAAVRPASLMTASAGTMGQLWGLGVTSAFHSARRLPVGLQGCGELLALAGFGTGSQLLAQVVIASARVVDTADSSGSHQPSEPQCAALGLPLVRSGRRLQSSDLDGLAVLRQEIKKLAVGSSGAHEDTAVSELSSRIVAAWNGGSGSLGGDAEDGDVWQIRGDSVDGSIVAIRSSLNGKWVEVAVASLGS